MDAADVVVERYRVVPAVDVERLRGALDELAAGDGVVLALGPSLLGTLDVDAVPPGTYPFVDPSRQVRPLRDDVVVLAAGRDTPRARLAGLAELVERVPVIAAPGPPGALAVPPQQPDVDRVLVLARADRPAGAVAGLGLVPGPADADAAVPVVVGQVQAADATAVGADLYVVLAAGRLRAVLAPR